MNGRALFAIALLTVLVGWLFVADHVPNEVFWRVGIALVCIGSGIAGAVIARIFSEPPG